MLQRFIIFLLLLALVGGVLHILGVAVNDNVVILTLLTVLGYTTLTFEILRANTDSVEYAKRPVIGYQIDRDSEQCHIGFAIRNYSNTDAIGLVKIELKINGEPNTLDDAAYEGKELWYFPAHDFVHGHKEFSGKLKRLDVLTKPGTVLELVAYVYYKTWSHDPSIISKGKRYYSPVKRWIWSQREEGRWVPQLTSKKKIVPPEPDWILCDNEE